MEPVETQFTSLRTAYPPKDELIDWITPSGQIVRGRWIGGSVWMPQGSDVYVYYAPISWRIAKIKAADPTGGR